MKETVFKVVTNRALTDSVYEMKLRGDTSDITAPGQFVNIKLDSLFLRRPISVCNVVGEELTLVYKVVGKGTRAMSMMGHGAKLDILTGLIEAKQMSLLLLLMLQRELPPSRACPLMRSHKSLMQMPCVFTV